MTTRIRTDNLDIPALATHFFASAEAGREWAKRSDGTYVASIAEGFEYGRLYNQGRRGAALAGDR